MSEEHFYHMFANGDDAKNFITSESEFKAAFNRFALCSHLTGARVLSFSVEDTHPHALLSGSQEVCTAFKDLYESLSLRSIVQSRGSTDGVELHCEIVEVTDNQYLMNVASYTVVQATKDGKPVMPYDYRYGTGSLYFRSRYSVQPWLIDENGKYTEPVRFADLTVREKRRLCASRSTIPGEWLVCNGFILPDNYVDVKAYEQIFKTHNCFRAFLCSSKSKDEQLLAHMAEVRGVTIEDLEARKLCKELCEELFGKHSTRHLGAFERIELARRLRSTYRLAYRQISALIHIPESEIRKYVK